MLKTKLFFLLIGIVLWSTSFSQVRDNYSTSIDGYVDASIIFGTLENNFKRVNMASAYNQPLNVHNGSIAFSAPFTLGADVNLGYFCNSKGNLALSLGLILLNQSGKMHLDSFHIEYNSTDKNKNVFRQLITSNNINDFINGNSISIPFILHYQKGKSKYTMLSLDAGVIYDIYKNYNYNTESVVNYEAIYQYKQGNVKAVTVYDNNPKPNSNDVFITDASFKAHDHSNNETVYFTNLYNNGYNVGLNQKITKSGNVNYQAGSFGFIIKPSLSYRISSSAYFNISLYYLSQNFSLSSSATRSMFLDKVGQYNGLLNEVSTVTSSSIGLSFGLKFLLKSKTDESIFYVLPVW